MIKEIRMPLYEFEQLKEIERRYNKEKNNYVHNHVVTLRFFYNFEIRQHKVESQFSPSMPEEIKSIIEENIQSYNSKIDSIYIDKYYNIPKWIRNLFA